LNAQGLRQLGLPLKKPLDPPFQGSPTTLKWFNFGLPFFPPQPNLLNLDWKELGWVPQIINPIGEFLASN